MFKKLLKYDFKASKRFGIPLTIGILIAGILGSLDIIIISLLEFNSGTENFFVVCAFIICILMIMLVYVALVIGASAMQIIIMVDFYKNLGTDEGYLTFTLPVKSRDIIFSKLTNCTIWTLITGVATFIAFTLIGVCADIAVGPSTGPDMFPGLSLADFGISNASFVGFVILMILFVIASFFNSVLLYFGAIFFGTVIAKKNKAIAAILSVIVVNTIYGIVTSIVLTIAIISGASLSATTNPMVAVNIIISIFTVLLCALNVVFFEVLKNMMEKKLNLA